MDFTFIEILNEFHKNHSGTHLRVKEIRQPGENYAFVDINTNIYGVGTECGFWKHKKMNKIYFQCAYYEEYQNEVMFCHYDKRKDHHEACHGQHKHDIKQKRKCGPLDQHVVRSIKPESIERIYETIGHYVAVSNSSISSGSSQELFNIIYAAIEYIKKNHLDIYTTPLNQIIPKCGPERIRNTIIRTAEEIRTKTIHSIQSSDYISICLDAGTIGNRHFVDFVLSSRGKTFPLEIVDVGNLDSEGYANLALQILDKDILKNVKISAFVGDSLPAQVKGLHPLSKKSFQKRKETDIEKRKILFIPCTNHRLQNAFKKSYREDPKMKIVTDSIHSLSISLRKPSAVSVLHSVCPNPIETRWLYVYDVAYYIYVHRQDILSKLNIVISDDIYSFLMIIAPIRSVMNILGKESTCLPDVYPLIQKLIQILKELDIKDWNDSINCLIHNIEYYTISSKEGSLYLLSYALTPRGRSDLYRKQYNKEVAD